MFIFQKLQNQKPKKEATSINEAKIQALSKNNNVEDTPQDFVITQGKHLKFRGKTIKMYIFLPDLESLDTNIRTYSSPETSQGIKIMSLEKEIKIRVCMCYSFFKEISIVPLIDS